MRAILFLSIFVLSVSISNAQQDSIINDSSVSQEADTVTKYRYFTYEYEEGEIFLTDQTSRKGLLKFNEKVFFKADEGAKKEKFDENSLTGFVLNQDTFIVGYNVQYSQKGSFVREKNFLKRLKSGKAQLYKAIFPTSSGSTGIMYYYKNLYVRKNDESSFTLIPQSKEKFKEVMASYFSENEELSRSILNDLYTFDDLELIIDIYNKR